MNGAADETRAGAAIREYVVDAADAGSRLDVWLAGAEELSRSYVKTLTERGDVTVNGKTVKAGYALRAGDFVRAALAPPQIPTAVPQDIPVDFVYLDDDIAVVNKPQGMVVHPAPGAYDGTLVNALLWHLDRLSGINGVLRPGIVHRLDKDTSGLLVVAENDAAHASLQKQIAEKTARRIYTALTDGAFVQDSGTVRTFLARSSRDRKTYAVSREGVGREAITLYRVLRRYRGYTLAEFELKTGRTHQIRVHCRHLGHPVTGDPVYGGSNKFGLQGQLLHACRLELTHPRTGERMVFTAPLPDYFQKVLDRLEPI